MNTTPRDNATEAELAEQFPCSNDPYGIWYNKEAKSSPWGVNDANGDAIVNSPSYETSLVLADALRIRDLSQVDNRRTGGLAAMLALLKMESITEERSDDEGVDAALAYHYEQQARAIKAITDAAGEISPFLHGFIATLAEHASYCQETGAPSLLHWKAQAAMTAGEIVLSRARMEESMREGTEVPA